MGNIDSDPAAAEFLSGVNGGATSAEWIEDNVTLTARSAYNALEESEWLLSGIAKTLLSLRVYWRDIVPKRINCFPG